MMLKVLATCLLVTAVQSIQLVTHPNGAVVPSEEAAVLVARAHHQAAIEAKTVDDYSAAIKAAHAAQLVNTGVFPQVGDAAAFLNNFNLIYYPNGAVVPSEGAAILAARAKHFAAINAAKMDHLANNYLAKPQGQAVADNLLKSPSNLVFHPNGAVVPSEDAAILAARAHNLAAQATHIDLLAKNSLYVPFGYPAPATKESLGFALDLINAVNFIDMVVKMIDDLLKLLFSSGDAAANEVAALQAARTKLVTTKADLQAVNDNLATKEAVILKAAAKAALLSNSGLNTPAGYSTAPTTMGSPLSLNLVTYPNGAIVPTEGADILAARASHQAAHDATASSVSTADHSAIPEDDFAAHSDQATRIRHDTIKLVSHPGGAVAPAEGFALATARAKHLAAHKAASDASASIETEQTVDLVTDGV